MNSCLSWDITATDAATDADADADGGKTAPAAGAWVVRRLLVMMLLTAAALDLTRCGLVMAAARHTAPTAGLVTVGLAAAVVTARTARGCQAGRRWAALLIGVLSAPQAAASGFRSPFTIPDAATAALGILLAITILATAGDIRHTGSLRQAHATPRDTSTGPRPQASVQASRSAGLRGRRLPLAAFRGSP